VQFELIVDRRERIVEFLLSLAHVMDGGGFGRREFGGWGYAKVFYLLPTPAEWGFEPGSNGLGDTETGKFFGPGLTQALTLRQDGGGCREDVISVQPKLKFEHVCVENDTSVIVLEAFPNHPSKGNAGKAVRFAVSYGSAANILRRNGE
jgi:hypothetical protein